MESELQSVMARVNDALILPPVLGNYDQIVDVCLNADGTQKDSKKRAAAKEREILGQTLCVLKK